MSEYEEEVLLDISDDAQEQEFAEAVANAEKLGEPEFDFYGYTICTQDGREVLNQLKTLRTYH